MAVKDPQLIFVMDPPGGFIQLCSQEFCIIKAVCVHMF